MRLRLLAVAFPAVTLMAISSSVGAVTKLQLESKALSISNFPTGWSVAKSSSSGSDTGGCLAGVGRSLGRGDVTAKVAFHDGKAPGLGEGLSEGRDAKDDYARANSMIASCKNLSLTLDGTRVTGTIGSMSLPTLGSQTNAYAATLHVQGVNVGIDYVFFRVGPVVGIIAYEDLGQPVPSSVQAYFVEAVNKIEGKPTVTPGRRR